ncbi:MAG: undecaprenyl-diphosphate phosphatase [Myxococcota bacterium]|nr:undecaprenyl-diphosphate phosphatase [Myxococcota bacterium]
MSEALAALLLGVLQGLTEFLPVSSSGHLVLLQQFVPVSGDHVAFDLALHVGTLVPVLWVFRHDLIRIVVDPVAGQGPWREREGVRVAFWVLLASIPTAAIGLGMSPFFDSLYNAQGAEGRVRVLGTVGVAFAVTGALLWATRRAGDGNRGLAGIGWWQALLIGVIQGLAITPGISRSGSTIALALFLGLERGVAARYSFLLSIPAILGGALLELGDVDAAGLAWGPLALGMLAAGLTGYGALRLLVRMVEAGELSRFSWYLWVLAVGTIGLAVAA